MKRFSSGLLAALAAVAGPTSASASASGAARVGPAERVVATLDACHASPAQSTRYATFGAQMTQVKLGKSMAVRFDLYQRNPREGFRAVPVRAPGFGVWHPSAAGVGIFRYSQEVANLPAPAGFRVLASYRWQNAHRRVIKRARRTSPTCVLPDERPNLVAESITAQRRPDQSTSTYDVVVRNVGLSAAGPFRVRLSVSGFALPELTLPGLAPSAQQVLVFSGPTCVSGGEVLATVDPARAIDETTKADDVRTLVC